MTARFLSFLETGSASLVASSPSKLSPPIHIQAIDRHLHSSFDSGYRLWPVNRTPGPTALKASFPNLRLLPLN
ncbi:hypothetical protein PGTUg99_000013, partial [Puccinia graminis f. sp. tritici]